MHFGFEARQEHGLLTQPRCLHVTNQDTSFVKCARAARCSRAKHMAMCSKLPVKMAELHVHHVGAIGLHMMLPLTKFNIHLAMPQIIYKLKKPGNQKLSLIYCWLITCKYLKCLFHHNWLGSLHVVIALLISKCSVFLEYKQRTWKIEMTSPLQMEADKETINPLKTMAAVFPVFH